MLKFVKSLQNLLVVHMIEQVTVKYLALSLALTDLPGENQSGLSRLEGSLI